MVAEVGLFGQLLQQACLSLVSVRNLSKVLTASTLCYLRAHKAVCSIYTENLICATVSALSNDSGLSDPWNDHKME